ncbi:MAG TPA: tetratricopeptide repeat protein [Gemmatimonadaceae bacterium]|jgi:tetratricopeptide (TPR) repeat protein
MARISGLLTIVLLFSLAAAQRAASQQQQAQVHTSPAIAHADSAFQRSDWHTAADAYGAIVKQDATNGMGWFRLGASFEQLGTNEDAGRAYEQALRVGFQPVNAELRLARVLARMGKNTDALSHLQHVAGLGIDPSIFENEPAFAPLRATSEYAAMKKKADALRYPCRDEHAFDFWVGNFDTTPWNQPDAPAAGQLTNTREYEGCVIVERFAGQNGGAGMSMAFFDANRQVWRMIWNDDANSSNDFEGSYRDGAMRFNGWVLDASGKKILASNVLENVSPDVIRHIYSTSSDSGKTWNVRSDGRFVRRK